MDAAQFLRQTAAEEVLSELSTTGGSVPADRFLEWLASDPRPTGDEFAGFDHLLSSVNRVLDEARHEIAARYPGDLSSQPAVEGWTADIAAYRCYSRAATETAIERYKSAIRGIDASASAAHPGGVSVPYAYPSDVVEWEAGRDDW